ncbi:MAG: stage II sporulation protein R [Clostridiales bacterium]|nr:stage II sporulation protein R [Clostridiales bacterium]
MKRRNRLSRRCGAALLAAAALLLLALSVGGGEQQALAGQVVRLHVLANSDSDGDQALKLRVRDAVLACAQPLLAGTTSQQEAEAALSGALETLEEAGAQTVRAAGYDYPVTASLETDWFPTRTYGDFSLPAGYYPTLRVEIGQGSGHNWWCVVYPPLCSVGVEEVEETSLGLTEDQISLITQDGGAYEFRFQCAEWFGQLQSWLERLQDASQRS